MPLCSCCLSVILKHLSNSKSFWFPIYLLRPPLQADGNRNGEYFVARSMEAAMVMLEAKHGDMKEKGLTLEQDEDVLDTWFR
jgi:valyl-tRNA synthetase